eukprot:357115-Chlamydomonas_euryale.AAC.5
MYSFFSRTWTPHAYHCTTRSSERALGFNTAREAFPIPGPRLAPRCLGQVHRMNGVELRTDDLKRGCVDVLAGQARRLSRAQLIRSRWRLGRWLVTTSSRQHGNCAGPC